MPPLMLFARKNIFEILVSLYFGGPVLLCSVNLPTHGVIFCELEPLEYPFLGAENKPLTKTTIINY